MGAVGLRKAECFAWTSISKTLLTDLWAPEMALTTCQIAHRMGTTKNSVISAARRFGLPPRPNAIRRKLTNEQIAALLAARRDGILPRIMQQTLGLSADQVAYWYHKRGPWKPRQAEPPDAH
jgi:hypothetical protein